MTPGPVVPRTGVPFGRAEKARLTAEVLTTYVRVRRALRRGTLPQTLAALRRDLAPGGGLGPVEGARLGRAVVRTLEPLPTDSRCLSRSLVLLGLLARRGVDVRLVIGVSRTDGFAAHAWVEQDGRPLLESGGDSFDRLAEF